VPPRAPHLRSIVFLGTGASTYIDMSSAARRLRVRTVRHYADRTVTEHAFALLLAAARDIARMDRDIQAGRWAASEGLKLAGRTLGVVGVGGVGGGHARHCLEPVGHTRACRQSPPNSIRFSPGRMR
jgi:D-3-phosphoglycerate dehydrogenase / 2-oxoglutarate reductase